MTNIAIAGCTGKLGSAIMKDILKRDDVMLKYAIARDGNPHVGESVSELIDGKCDLRVINDICDALLKANSRLSAEEINICSVRGGSIFGEHEVIFANCKDEVTVYKHQVSSRETFADGAVEVAKWIVKQGNGFYTMDEFFRE